jgi:hypothetical protein
VLGGQPYMQATYSMAKLTGSVAAPTPRGTALHEMGHVVASHTPDVASSAHIIATRQAINAGGGRTADFISSEISTYASAGPHELMAEAFSDVIHNGEHASDLSHEIFAAVQIHYESDPGA